MTKRNMRWFGRVVSGVLTLCLMFSGFSAGQLIVSAAELTGYRDETVVRFKNVGSGKYLNVHYGQDANKVNVYQWTADGSVEQTFKLRYNEEEDCYLIGAMCSSNGNGRVLDIVKANGQVTAGCNVQIYNATDPVAQQWQFAYRGNGQYIIFPTANPYAVLTAYGNSNGSSGGTDPTDAGNVYLSAIPMASYVTYTEDQLWVIEETDENPDPPIDPGIYRITSGDNKYLTLDVEDNYNVCHVGNAYSISGLNQEERYQLQAQQIWTLEYLCIGYYLISPVTDRTRKVVCSGNLDTLGGGISVQVVEGASLCESYCQWKIIFDEDDNSYRIVSKGDGLSQAMTVLNGNTANYTDVVRVPYYGTSCQQWTFSTPTCPGQNNDHIEGHILEFNKSDRKYHCAVCTAEFLTPQEEDYELLLEEDLFTVFALQRAARLLEVTQQKEEFVEACYKMTDVIRNKSIYEGSHEYEYVNSDGECLSTFPYTRSASTMDTYISIHTQRIDIENIVARNLFWSVDSLLPSPFDMILEAAQDLLRDEMEEDTSYSGAGLLSELLDALLKVTNKEQDKDLYNLLSTCSKVVSVVDFAHSYALAAANCQFQEGDICVQIQLNNGVSYDTFTGHYRVVGSTGSRSLRIIDEELRSENRQSSPFENQYSYSHYSTLPGDTTTNEEEGMLF